MANEIDRVMNLDPLHLTKDDIDTIILYQRKARGMADAGIKPKRGQNAAGESVKIDISKLIPPKTPIARRF